MPRSTFKTAVLVGVVAAIGVVAFNLRHTPAKAPPPPGAAAIAEANAFFAAHPTDSLPQKSPGPTGAGKAPESTLYRMAHADLQPTSEGDANAHASAADNPQAVEYDPAKAQQREIWEIATENRRTCIRARIALGLRMGVRNREELVHQTSEGCSRQMIALKIESPELAVATTEAMAYSIVDDVAREGQ